MVLVIIFVTWICWVKCKQKKGLTNEKDLDQINAPSDISLQKIKSTSNDTKIIYEKGDGEECEKMNTDLRSTGSPRDVNGSHVSNVTKVSNDSEKSTMVHATDDSKAANGDEDVKKENTDNNIVHKSSAGESPKHLISTANDSSDEELECEWTMSNALVLIICIREYGKNGYPSLDSAKKDMENMIDLWENKYNYTIVKNDNYFVDASTVDDLLDEGKKLLKNKNNKFDGFIFIFSGHGYNGGIIASCSRKISLKTIQLRFSAQLLPNFKDCPKIFIIDACRTTAGLFNHNSRKTRSGTHEQDRKYHPLANSIVVYGNTAGKGVFSGDEDGGTLIREVYGKFGKSASQKDGHPQKTLQQLIFQINHSVQRKWNDQIVERHDRLDKNIFVAPKRNAYQSKEQNKHDPGKDNTLSKSNV